MQRIDLRAAVCVKVLVGIVTADGIGLAVPLVGATAFSGDSRVHRVVDGQVQGYDGVVTVDCRETLCVIARYRVGCPVPRVAVAACRVELRCDGIFQGEVQGDDRVAAVDGL